MYTYIIINASYEMLNLKERNSTIWVFLFSKLPTSTKTIYDWLIKYYVWRFLFI